MRLDLRACLISVAAAAFTAVSDDTIGGNPSTVTNRFR
jgi:hypothetical protein